MATNISLIFTLACGTITAHIILKKGFIALGGIQIHSGFVAEIIRVLHSPYITGALALQAIIAVFWIYLVSRTPLTYLFSMSGAFFYILMALTSVIFLGERLSLIQWIGVIMISLGVVCLNFRSL